MFGQALVRSGCCGALLLLLFAANAQASGPEALDLSQGLKQKHLSVDTGATIVSPPPRRGLIVALRTDHQHPWPGIHIDCPAGHWDLSRFSFVEVEVENPTDRPERIEVRVDDPLADGLLHCCGGGKVVAGHATATLQVPLERGKPPWVNVQLAGMNGYPWGIPRTWGKPGEGEVDAAHVVRLIVFTPHPSEDHAFKVLFLHATGDYRAPTPLLEDPKKFFPFIDEFGQYIHRDWLGKVHSVAELHQQADAEQRELAAHPSPTGWDRFGGFDLGPLLQATGFFRTEKVGSKWWLVDPDGHLFFSQGIDCVSLEGNATPIDQRDGWFATLPREKQFADCYQRAWAVVHGSYEGTTPLCFDFTQADLIRKYGDNWGKTVADLSHRRLRSWGVNTMGSWSAPWITHQDKTPYTVMVAAGGRFLAGSEGWWGKFHDVYDASFQETLRQAMSQHADQARDPWCIGFFVDNELGWGADGVSLAVAALKSPADQPAKVAMIKELEAKYGTIDRLNRAWGTTHATWDALRATTQPPDPARAHDDLTSFYAHFAETYFRIARQVVKEVAPHHLYLGCRFSEGNAAAAEVASRFCDVVSFNVYARSPGELPMKADVPILIGEFHFGALDRGMFHPGLVATSDQAARADAYRQYMIDALRHPRIVGCHWFQYLDEPTTGRFYDGENYQIGFVSAADTPYAEVIAAARDVSRWMYGGK